MPDQTNSSPQQTEEERRKAVRDEAYERIYAFGAILEDGVALDIFTRLFPDRERVNLGEITAGLAFAIGLLLGRHAPPDQIPEAAATMASYIAMGVTEVTEAANEKTADSEEPAEQEVVNE